ncbi:MAG: hypothetical protein J6038_04210, partial [Bacilli bacterium]|nr:hypothetical protein [Bacilli bacterium]
LQKLQDAALKPTYGLFLTLNGEKFAKYDGQWFYVTPIAWEILHKEGKECLVVSKDLIDARRYDPKDGDYASSEIRKWLHEHFLPHAFSHPEYVCRHRFSIGLFQEKDDVTLLKEEDVLNPNFGFRKDEDRISELSDYAATRAKLQGIAPYWLQSKKKKSKDATIVSPKGELGTMDSANPLSGIRPCLKIRLP